MDFFSSSLVINNLGGYCQMPDGNPTPDPNPDPNPDPDPDPDPDPNPDPGPHAGKKGRPAPRAIRTTKARHASISKKSAVPGSKASEKRKLLDKGTRLRKKNFF